MRTIIIRFLSLSFFFLFFILQSQSQSCLKSGSAKSDKQKKLNIAKNKSITTSKTPVSMKLDSFISNSKQDDKNWFTNGNYIVTEGYLINATEEGPESCNCEQANAKKKDGDVHMYLGLTKNAKPTNCIIIEITPNFKKLHPDYEKYLTLKKKIQVTGFLLYDYLHRKDAMMTCKNCDKAWRNNCWEIHPITNIEVVN